MVEMAAAIVSGSWIVAIVTFQAFIVSAHRGGRARVTVGPIGRLLRWQRSVVARTLCAWAGWLHIVDVALGTPSAPVAPTPSVVVRQNGPASLIRYTRSTTPTWPEPVLIVHSLVTRPWVLDLTEARSFVRSLLEAGHDVWLLDWGSATSRDAARGVNDSARMLHSARRTVEETTGSDRVHVIGYCLGGTLAAIDAAAWNPKPASLTLVAPVIDTGTRGRTWAPHGIARIVAHPWLHCGLVLDERGLVPGELVREAFHALRPRALRTVWSRLRMPNVPELRSAYGAMARWTWEQPALPGATFLDIVDLYRTNALAAGGWTIDGETVDLGEIDLPTLVTASERDHIVPPDSAVLPGLAVAERRTFPGGHVGMMVGAQAPALYATIVEFLARQQCHRPRSSSAASGWSKNSAQPSGVA